MVKDGIIDMAGYRGNTFEIIEGTEEDKAISLILP